MLNRFTYKQKNWLLLAGFLILSVSTYTLAIKKTIKLKNECQEMEAQIRSIDQAKVKIPSLEKQLMYLDNLAGLTRGESQFQQALLAEVGSYCAENNITLKEFPGPHVYRNNDFYIETSPIMVEGRFDKLVGLVYHLEQVNRLGKIASVRFEAKKDVRTKRISLIAKIYIQNVKKAPKT